MRDERVLLIGSGPMAVDYWKVLQALGRPTVVVGRGEGSAGAFRAATGADCLTGGLDAFERSGVPIPQTAIVAVSVEQLAVTAGRLIDAGVRTILLEKPGALTGDELTGLAAHARAADAAVYIAYNRRFYAATLHARSLIATHGIQSLAFEFTEWSHVIGGIAKDVRVKEGWLIANSTHVIDLAFFLGGWPAELTAFTSGTLDWHPSSAVFAGAGRTDRGALFSYQANWTSAGRWGVELMLPTQRLILRPLEKLQSIPIGKIAIEDIAIDDAIDQQFKPGLFRQVEAMLDGRTDALCTLDEQVGRWQLYREIAGYDDTR